MPFLINPLKSEPVEQINTTSRIVDTSYCPVCNIKMQTLFANGVESYVCLQHRINLPIKEED